MSRQFSIPTGLPTCNDPRPDAPARSSSDGGSTSSNGWLQPIQKSYVLQGLSNGGDVGIGCPDPEIRIQCHSTSQNKYSHPNSIPNNELFLQDHINPFSPAPSLSLSKIIQSHTPITHENHNHKRQSSIEITPDDSNKKRKSSSQTQNPLTSNFALTTIPHKIIHESKPIYPSTISRKKPRGLLVLPPEILIILLKNINNCVDLYTMSQVSKLIQGLIDEKMWRDLYIIHLPRWGTGGKVNNLKGALMWSRMIIRDYLRRTFLWLDRSSIEIRQLPQLDVLDDEDSSVRPFWKNHDNDTSKSIMRYIHARNQESNLQAETRLQAMIGKAQHYRPQHMISGHGQEDLPRWRNVGPPVLYTDPDTQITVASYMQARTFDNHTDHQIAVYELTNHKKAIAIIPSSYWEHKDADKLLDPELSTANLGPAQLMDMKHFPDPNYPDRMRVIFVVAFGERNLGSANVEDRDLYIVDIWSLLRVVEVSMCSVRPSQTAFNPATFKGRVETIAPRSRQERVRIRMAKIYTEDRNGQPEDRIALFGIYQGARLRTVLMTSPLLATAPQPPNPSMKATGSSSVVPSSWECHVLGGKNALQPSCMTLFPAQSDFGNLLVVMDQQGNGEIWDWQRRVRVSVLILKAPDVPVGGSRSNHRDNLYYWGVHVNWAIEEPVTNDKGSTPFSLGSSRRSSGDFRVVALADGESTEWESCYFHIDEDDLRKFSKAEYTPESSETPWTIESTSRHFEYCTRGIICTENSTSGTSSALSTLEAQSMEVDSSSPSNTTTQEIGEALNFIAYLIWDHYRISITSQYGITIFDMDKENSDDILSSTPVKNREPQRVTMIEGGDSDPLIDIATVGSYLFITRKYSHMVWEF